MGLRVTDNDGVTAQTTRTVDVAEQVVITDTTSPRLTPLKKVLSANRAGRVGIRLRCPAGEQRCVVNVRLRGLAGPLAGRNIAVGTRTIAGGRTVTMNLALSAKARQQLRQGKRIRARAIVIARDAVGNQGLTRTPVLVRR